MSNIIWVSAKKLLAWQVHRAKRDLAQRPEDIRLEDVMLFRAKGSRMIKPKNIPFDDDE